MNIDDQSICKLQQCFAKILPPEGLETILK